MNGEIEVNNICVCDTENKDKKERKEKKSAKTRIYIFKPIARKKKKDSIDEVEYCDIILLPLPYLFRSRFGMPIQRKSLWLIEDNARSHIKIAKLCPKEKESKNILKVDWPANSSYLHPIENVWDYKNSQLAPKWNELRGAGKMYRKKQEIILQICGNQRRFWLKQRRLQAGGRQGCRNVTT